MIRPIIAKFPAHKSKYAIFMNAPNLKGTDFSIGQNFVILPETPAVTLAFARIKAKKKFQIRFKHLRMSSKRYIFDDDSTSAKEIP